MKRILIILIAAIGWVDVTSGASLVATGAKVEKLAGGMKFTEGPVWMPEQKKVVFSDFLSHNSFGKLRKSEKLVPIP